MGDVLKENLGDNSGGYTVKPKPSFATWDEFFENWKRVKRPFKVEASYPYRDPETDDVDFYVVRYIPTEGGRKVFFQASRNGSGWVAEAPKGKTPIFNRKGIRDAKNVLIVEGEKCVAAFTKLKIPGWGATTNPGGANGVERADWSPVRGKNCYIWHDNDEAGLKHFETVKKIVADLGCAVYRVRIEELGLDEKEDIADYIDQCEGLLEDKVAAVSLVLGDSECLSRTADLEQRLADIKAGKHKHIPFVQMPILSSLMKALIPGTVTTMVGDPGAGKSFLVLEQFWTWQLALDYRVDLLMLEENQAFHQQRMLAQMARMSDITDPDFVEEHIEMVERVFAEYREVIERVARRLTTVETQWTLDRVAEWVEEKAEGDADVIIVDPVTAAENNDKPWVADQKFMFRVKQAMERTHKRLLLNTHPRLGKAGAPGLSGLAGGAAYPRFSQAVAWLRHYEQIQEGKVMLNGYNRQMTYKRTMEIRKARNGRGQGSCIALELGAGDLRFRELGIIDQTEDGNGD